MHQPPITSRISEGELVKDARGYMKAYRDSHTRHNCTPYEIDDKDETILSLVAHIDRMQHYFNTLALLTGNDPEEAIDIVEDHLRTEKGWT